MRTVEIPVAGDVAQAYLAQPAGDAPVPGVLLFIDAIGLRPRIADMADRIASWGYVVLAPNIFHRLGDVADLAPAQDLREPEATARFLPQIRLRARRLSAEDSLADTADYLAALRENPRVHPGAMGAIGYCMGARLATRAAGAHPDEVGAVGGFHGGRLVTDKPDSPHRWVRDSRAQYVYLHADRDASMPRSAVRALGETLAQAGRPGFNEIQPGAAHGYTMADTPAYDEAACERHFDLVEELFARTLPSGSRD